MGDPYQLSRISKPHLAGRHDMRCRLSLLGYTATAATDGLFSQSLTSRLLWTALFAPTVHICSKGYHTV
jgi:hypothetical protein